MSKIIENGGLQFEVFEDGSANVIKGESTLTGELTIPASIECEGKSYPVVLIGERAFSRCARLTGITIPEGVQYIEKETFRHCMRLEKVILPKSLVKIGELAFEICHRLASITIPGSVSVIGKRAFADCQSLTSVTLDSVYTS